MICRSNKYRNKKVLFNNEVFDSKKEAERYRELLMLQKAGKISELERQVWFELIPAQYEYIELPEVYTRGSKKGQYKVKKVCLEKSVKYVADFVYKENGKTIVEDTKGMRTTDYILKRKLMLYIHDIKIREI